MMRKNLIALMASLAIIPVAAAAETLQVTVSGIKAGEGNLRIGIFDRAHRAKFPEGKYLLGVEVPATEKEMTVEVPDIEPGEYAIAVIQDLNKNGKLDRNFVKYPTEPYGFSGGGSTAFDKSAINLEDVNYAVSIKLK
jgi:uncharacterized protein (DUF2141 family)